MTNLDDSNDAIPEIDYLTRDYDGYRQLILDHLKLRVPEWDEPSPADVGNVIVEALAYTADALSYYQDATATEAYLGTARRRRSIKRHTRLLDYTLHEGCNARAWVQVQVNQPVVLPRRTQLITSVPTLPGGNGAPVVSPAVVPANSPQYLALLSQPVRIFETMHTDYLYPEHNQINLAFVEGEKCYLRQGDTQTVLRGELPNLQVGSILVFEEVLSTVTGNPLGADPTHRHAVRIRSISRSRQGGLPVVAVDWDADDALPFDIAVSLFINGEFTPNVSLARGNIILADHGQTIAHEALPDVLPGVRYRPALNKYGLTFSGGLVDPVDLPSASAGMLQDVRQAIPEVSLFERVRTVEIDTGQSRLTGLASGLHDRAFARVLHTRGVFLAAGAEVKHVGSDRLEIRDRIRRQHLVAENSGGRTFLTSYRKWKVRPDLLSSGPVATDYIVDVEDDGRAYLRFGFGGHGRLPQPGDQFQVSYRVGTGSEGNIRSDTIATVVSDNPAILGVRNPMPAQGGTDREPIEDARLYAPQAFQTQERCVTPDDFIAIAQRYPQVLDASAEVRWMGSRYTAFLYIQRAGGQRVDRAFLAGLGQFMAPFLLSGYDLAIHPPRYVPLAIRLAVTVRPGFDRNQVESLQRQVFTSGLKPDGTPGFFNPDSYRFGQAIYLSQVLSAAMGVPGVAHVQATRFVRLDLPPEGQPADLISIGPFEILRLANDPSNAQLGTLELDVKGSR